MEYIYRSAEKKFLSMSAAFKAVMLVGARQVGKSTMLRHLAENQDRTYVSMDNSKVRELAQSDPELFFQIYKPPILIDEVQKAPELFERIKIICDETDERGLFWLTGSESRKLLNEAGDSLSGRICIIRMYSLSRKEKYGIDLNDDIDFSFDKLVEKSKIAGENSIVEIFDHIWRGGMPDVQNLDEEQISEYWNSYIETYLMRDAVDDNGIKDTIGFRKFVRACSAFTGQLLNYADLASAAGISGVTAKEWVKVLQAMGIIYLLEPYSSKELKRMIKTPKLYFCDTGLCAYLSSWTSRDTLMNGAAAGHFFENYVVGELLRNIEYGKNKVNMNFYRDTNQKEIDIVIEENSKIHPFEIKKSANPEKKAVKTFTLLGKSGKELSIGGIICMTDSPFPIDSNNYLIPANIF